jgi:hypothetical protein
MTQAFPYSLQTLNGNWFEDRLQPPGCNLATTSKKVSRPIESEIANISDRYDVLQRISRNVPRESYATPDDGFRETTPLKATDYAHPMSRKEVVRNPPEKPRFITTETVPEVCYEERRPIPGNTRGFGAVLNRHEENHDQRFWNTTTGDVFGKGDTRPRPRLESSGMRAAGTSVHQVTVKVGGLKTGKLCGEDYREGEDPAADTRIQRSWLYSQDPSIKHIGSAGKKPALPAADNELSLPIGEMLRNSKKLQEDRERRGLLFRTGTDITQGRGYRYGMSVFQDE